MWLTMRITGATKLIIYMLLLSALPNVIKAFYHYHNDFFNSLNLSHSNQNFLILGFLIFLFVLFIKIKFLLPLNIIISVFIIGQIAIMVSGQSGNAISNLGFFDPDETNKTAKIEDKNIVTKNIEKKDDENIEKKDDENVKDNNSEKVYKNLLDEYYDVIKNDPDYEVLKGLSERGTYDVDKIARNFCTVKTSGVDEYKIILDIHEHIELSDNDDYGKKVATKVFDYSRNLGRKYYCY